MEEEEEIATTILPKKRKSRSPSKSGDESSVGDHVNKPKRRQALVPKSIAHYAAEQVGVEYNMMHSFSLSSCKNGKTIADGLTKDAALMGSGRTDEETKDDDQGNGINKGEDGDDVDQTENAVESGDDDSEDEEKR